MRIKRVKPRSIKASTKRRNIKAEEEVMDEEVMDEEIVDDEPSEGGVDVAPEASDLLFEAEDVAELVAEVTGEEVAVTVDEDAVSFEVGDDVFTVEPEGDEEVLESTRIKRNKKSVKASKVLRRRPAAARARRR